MARGGSWRLTLIVIAVVLVVFFSSRLISGLRTPSNDADIVLRKIPTVEEGAYYLVAEEDLRENPLLADVLDAYWSPDEYPNADKPSQGLLVFRIPMTDAEDLLEYINTDGISHPHSPLFLKYQEDYFELRVFPVDEIAPLWPFADPIITTGLSAPA
jgi:hypothetical protein